MVKKISVFCLKLLITIILFYLIFTKIEFGDVVAEVHKLKFRDLSLLLFVMFVQLIIASARWYKILHILKIALTYKECLAYNWIGMFFSQALPSSIGGDAYKILQIKGLGCSYKSAFSSVINDRIFGLLGLLTLVLTFPFIALAMGHKQVLKFDLTEIMIVSMGVFFLFFCLPKTINFLRKIVRLREILNFIEEFFLVKNSSATVLFLIASSVCVHLITIVIFLLISSAMSLEINPIIFFILIPVMVLITTLPISIAGWGVREGFFVFSLGHFGIEPEKSAFISIFYGVLVLIFSVPGSSLWFLKNMNLNRRKT